MKNILLNDSGKIGPNGPCRVRIWHRFRGQPNECYTVAINNTIQDNFRGLDEAKKLYIRLVHDFVAAETAHNYSQEKKA